MTETTTTGTRRSIGRRIAGGIAATGAAVAITLAGAGVASAQSYVSQPLSPSGSLCSAQQYASYQVRADGFATAQGAKFKLLRNGVVVVNTPNRANNFAAELRSSYGTFPGPGYYQVCAQNTGTTNTTATVQLRTDYEF